MGLPATALEFYDQAALDLSPAMVKQVDYYRRITSADVDPVRFWYEYIWCVYAGGFSARVLAMKWPELSDAYGDWGGLTSAQRERVLAIIRRPDKFEACLKVAQMMQGGQRLHPESWWGGFKAVYLSTPKRMQGLPFIGPVTSYHLARNLGHEAVKPDLHLVRLAAHYGFHTPLDLCTFLAEQRGERVGVIDLVLFHAASTMGTLGIRQPGGR
jgi:hypothetical protein